MSGNSETNDQSIFLNLDDSLEVLFNSDQDVTLHQEARPATVIVSRLLSGVASSIRHCTRNRHRLYRISLKSHHILRQIHDYAFRMESSALDSIDGEAIASFERFALAIESLET